MSKATVSNDSMKDIFDMLKILSYNQTVLENRLEDALKNQMNTDILVNSINERLNALSMKFQALPSQSSISTSTSTSTSTSKVVTQQHTVSSEPHHPVTRSLSAISNDKSRSKGKGKSKGKDKDNNSVPSHTPLSATTTTLPVTKRGPGRPRKHPLPTTTTVEPTQRSELVSLVKDKLKTREEKIRENNGDTNVAPVFTSLPMNAKTHIAKSKAVFC